MAVTLGRYGIWALGDQLTPQAAREMERLGFGTVWIGASPPGDLALAESLLDATSNLTVATGIVNMWGSSAPDVATSYRRIVERHPDRFLLGVGIGHPEVVGEYADPYASIVAYLDDLDAGHVPPEGRALAALGPQVLAVARNRTAGAHPYLTTPDHTREARRILGQGPLLAPVQKVVLDTDTERARALGRESISFPCKTLSNYRKNLLRTGFTEDDLDTTSDVLADALVIHGDAAAIVRGLNAHLDAGADHVCAELLVGDGSAYLSTLASLAKALHSTGT